MSPFAKSTSFSAVNIAIMIKDCTEDFGVIPKDIMALLNEDKIKIEVPHIYNYSHLEDAFRFLQSGKSLGKVVAELLGTDLVPVSADSNGEINDITDDIADNLIPESWLWL